eukprot:gene25034-56157_t
MVWVSTEGWFVEQHGLMFEQYAGGRECLFTAWQPRVTAECAVRNSLAAAVLIVYAGAMLRLGSTHDLSCRVAGWVGGREGGEIENAAVAAANALSVLFIAFTLFAVEVV